MKKCSACGVRLSETAKFCGECGALYVAPKKEKEKPEAPKQVVLIRKIVYSIKEAAIALNISQRKLHQLIADGIIPACRQGKLVGITEWALEEYAKTQEVMSGKAMRGELKVL